MPTTNKSEYTEKNSEVEPVAETTTAARRRDDLFEAVVEACGMDYDEMTKSAKRSCAVAVAELRDVGANALNVRTRAVHYRAHFGDAALTPSALAKHWAQCAHPPSRVPRKTKSDPAMDYVRSQLGALR